MFWCIYLLVLFEAILFSAIQSRGILDSSRREPLKNGHLNIWRDKNDNQSFIITGIGGTASSKVLAEDANGNKLNETDANFGAGLLLLRLHANRTWLAGGGVALQSEVLSDAREGSEGQAGHVHGTLQGGVMDIFRKGRSFLEGHAKGGVGAGLKWDTRDSGEHVLGDIGGGISGGVAGKLDNGSDGLSGSINIAIGGGVLGAGINHTETLLDGLSGILSGNVKIDKPDSTFSLSGGTGGGFLSGLMVAPSENGNKTNIVGALGAFGGGVTFNGSSPNLEVSGRLGGGIVGGGAGKIKTNSSFVLFGGGASGGVLSGQFLN